MTHAMLMTGRAAALRIDNLDTDQIMPKQFLRGIDKSGLRDGVFYDLRYDEAGVLKPDFILNRPDFAEVSILIGGANFGCGSSREHAVWGLKQFGIQVIVAPSFAEIFYANAMNNRLLLVTLPSDTINRLMAQADLAITLEMSLDVAAQTLRYGPIHAHFDLTPRHRQMFLEDLDSIGLTLSLKAQIAAFAEAHWARQPWLRDVARLTWVSRKSMLRKWQQL